MQHISGAGHAGHKRVVAAGAVPADRRRALLGEPVGLAMGGVDVNGERPGAGARPGRPGSGERFAGDLVELTGRAPGERAQERAQRGGCSHPVAEHLLGGAGT